MADFLRPVDVNKVYDLSSIIVIESDFGWSDLNLEVFRQIEVGSGAYVLASRTNKKQKVLFVRDSAFEGRMLKKAPSHDRYCSAVGDVMLKMAMLEIVGHEDIQSSEFDILKNDVMFKIMELDYSRTLEKRIVESTAPLGNHAVGGIFEELFCCNCDFRKDFLSRHSSLTREQAVDLAERLCLFSKSSHRVERFQKVQLSPFPAEWRSIQKNAEAIFGTELKIVVPRSYRPRVPIHLQRSPVISMFP